MNSLNKVILIVIFFALSAVNNAQHESQSDDQRVFHPFSQVGEYQLSDWKCYKTTVDGLEIIKDVPLPQKSLSIVTKATMPGLGLLTIDDRPDLTISWMEESYYSDLLGVNCKDIRLLNISATEDESASILNDYFPINYHDITIEQILWYKYCSDDKAGNPVALSEITRNKSVILEFTSAEVVDNKIKLLIPAREQYCDGHTERTIFTHIK